MDCKTNLKYVSSKRGNNLRSVLCNIFHCQVFFFFLFSCERFCVITSRPFCREVYVGKCVVHSCWSVMRNLCSFHVYINFEVFDSDKFGPHIPAAALSLMHVTGCMSWCACVYWHVRFSARIRSLFAWMLSYTTVSGNPWLLSSMSTTTGVCLNYCAFYLLIIFINIENICMLVSLLMV